MDSIKIDTCDACSRKRSVRVFHSHGVPVLTQCRACDPRSYDALRRRSRPGQRESTQRTIKV